MTALVKCSCEVLGMLQLAADWDYEFAGEIHVDSTAALGVVGEKEPANFGMYVLDSYGYSRSGRTRS